MFHAKRLMPLAACILLASCGGPKAPDHTTAGQPAVTVADSVVVMPAVADAESVRAVLEADLKRKPLADGSIPDVQALVTGQQLTAKQIINKVAVPWNTPGATCTNQIVKNIGKCTFTPWRCTKQITTCVGNQVQLVQSMIDLVVKTTVALRYHVTLNNLAWSVSGNTVALNPNVTIRLDVDFTQSVLGAGVTAKGVAQCQSALNLPVTGTIGLRTADNGDVNPDVHLTKIQFDPGSLCKPANVNLSALAQLNPIDKATNDFIVGELDRHLRDMINKKSIGKHVNTVDLTSKLKVAAAKSLEPIPIRNVGWLLINPQELDISNLMGGMQDGKPVLMLTAGLRARPSLQIGGDEPKPKSADYAIKLGALGNGFTLAPEGVIPLSGVQANLDNFFAGWLRKHAKLAKFGVQKVDVYQSGDRLAFGVSFRAPGISSIKTIYFTARVGFQGLNKSLKLRDVSFGEGSVAFAEKRLAGLLDDELRAALEKDVLLPVGSSLTRVLNSLVSFHVTIKNAGSIDVNLDKAGVGAFWIANDALHFTLKASGTSKFIVDINPS
ncbi:MAG: DUF4403 family protein [Sphingomonas sp.]